MKDTIAFGDDDADAPPHKRQHTSHFATNKLAPKFSKDFSNQSHWTFGEVG